MGYHPGLEDDAFYLAAIKRNLNSALFLHDADFFRLQFQATIFDKLIAYSVRLSHLPLSWTILLWQLAAVFFVLHGCWRISRRCFSRPEALCPESPSTSPISTFIPAPWRPPQFLQLLLLSSIATSGSRAFCLRLPSPFTPSWRASEFLFVRSSSGTCALPARSNLLLPLRLRFYSL
jgi:hypothetical protein